MTLLPFPEARLLKTDRQVAFTYRLARIVAATGDLLRIGGHPRFTPREVRAGIGSLKADHDGQAFRSFAPDDVDWRIAAMPEAKIEAATPQTFRQVMFTMMTCNGRRAHGGIPGQLGKACARALLPCTRITRARTDVRGARPYRVKSPRMGQARAELNVNRLRREWMKIAFQPQRDPAAKRNAVCGNEGAHGRRSQVA